MHTAVTAGVAVKSDKLIFWCLFLGLFLYFENDSDILFCLRVQDLILLNLLPYALVPSGVQCALFLGQQPMDSPSAFDEPLHFCSEPEACC